MFLLVISGYFSLFLLIQVSLGWVTGVEGDTCRSSGIPGISLEVVNNSRNMTFLGNSMGISPLILHNSLYFSGGKGSLLLDFLKVVQDI